jgi:hypothetical protein
LLARESDRSVKQATKRSNVASWEWRIPRGRVDSARIGQERSNGQGKSICDSPGQCGLTACATDRPSLESRPMEDFEELEFLIPAYTPETMPLDRLLQYLQQIGEVIGATSDMHLVRIDESSTKPVFHIPAPQAVEARERVAAVRSGNGTQVQRTAFNRIRRMVRQDGGKPASLKDHTGVILAFPPAPDEIGAISGVRQPSTFDGALIRIGGVGDFTPIQMQNLDGEVFSGFNAPRTLAKEMAQRLFEPIRVAGIGNWDRSSAGEWKLSNMLIQSYEPLDNDPLEEVFRKLKAAPVPWPSNADDILQAERESAP